LSFGSSGLEGHLSEIFSKASAALVLKILGAGFKFLFNVLLARFLGAEGAGVYFLALTVMMVASVVGRIGLDNSLLRFAAVSAERGDWNLVRGLRRLGMGIALVLSVAAALGILIAAPWISTRLFHEPFLTGPLRLMALAVVPFSLLTLQGELLKGLRRTAGATLVQGLGVSLVSVVVLAVVRDRLGVSGAVIAHLAATLIVLFLSLFLWRSAVPSRTGPPSAFDARLLLATSLPLFLVASMYLLMNWTDTVMLGIWRESGVVGQYGVAMRTAMLTSFILVAVNSIVAPKFAALYAENDRLALSGVARYASLLTTAFALPVLAVFVLFPRTVLSLFGPQFPEASTVLVVLAGAQFLNVLTGSVGYLLIMSGHEKLMRDIVIAAALFNVLLNALLIPPVGIEGAAVATGTSTVTLNLSAWLAVRFKLGLLVLPMPVGRNRSSDVSS
jgi:O-antigen/teichoic acid export membrane protein